MHGSPAMSGNCWLKYLTSRRVDCLSACARYGRGVIEQDPSDNGSQVGDEAFVLGRRRKLAFQERRSFHEIASIKDFIQRSSRIVLKNQS
ncbi:MULTISPECIES: hypothetical protein [unclassified Burkholderia]|uniref:hypothetical protein n=1 Tax=unclassified Burkholderia TaxID=2613784 RepID=UPI00158BAEE7|nr:MULTISPECIES: hypothetical protein [unclassified Burkholderia]